jgi:uncharacterized protein YegL
MLPDDSAFIPQIPFSGADFADNPEPRCPCLLILDTSGSMSGRPIGELNAGIRVFRDELLADSLAAKRVELAIITFGPVTVERDFATVDLFQAPQLIAGGDTPLGNAVERGLELLDERKRSYRANGIAYYRPWVFLITDGGPTDSWTSAMQKVHAGEHSKGFSFFAVGVEGANMEVLAKLAVREPLRLKELKFRDLFIWLSGSLSAVSRSAVGDQVPLSNPASPNGWASV